MCLRKIDENWLYGHRLGDPNRKGIFPVTHVTRLSLIDDKDDEATTTKKRASPDMMTSLTSYPMPLPARAVRDFHSNDARHLELAVGDYLLINSAHGGRWYVGENHLGKKGAFPVDCVELITNQGWHIYLINSIFNWFSIDRSLETICFYHSKQKISFIFRVVKNSIST